ncbi:MAG: hypothetical protein BWY67_02514 [Bacteroidetes bacterium ADurb.Bin397]|nr:MAG: hypothetical protein BWY67_02514 [Bacteroidetes bacterium ADurb.Bin397]
MPSDPASIPTMRKIIRAGIPTLPIVLLARILNNNSTEPMSRIFSELSVIEYFIISNFVKITK